MSFYLRSSCLVFALFLLIPSLARSQAPGDPPSELEAQVEMGVVTATGFEPGAEAVVFGVARVPGGYITRLVSRAVRLEADELGEVVYEAIPAESLPAEALDFDPTALAVWVVLDPARGEYTVLTPDGSRARERPFSTDALRQGPTGLLDRLVQKLEAGHLLLVRPTDGTRSGDRTEKGAEDVPSDEPVEPAGVWALALEDGSALDLDDARDGSFEVALADWRTVGDGPEPPEEVQAGDLIFVVEPTTLEFSIVRFVGREESR